MLGVAVGTLIRNQAGAIVAWPAYAVAVDAVLFAAEPSIGRYLPGKAGDALAGRAVEHLLTPGVGAAVLAAWTLVFIAAAAVRNEAHRRLAAPAQARRRSRDLEERCGFRFVVGQVATAVRGSRPRNCVSSVHGGAATVQARACEPVHTP